MKKNGGKRWRRKAYNRMNGLVTVLSERWDFLHFFISIKRETLYLDKMSSAGRRGRDGMVYNQDVGTG